MDQIRAVRLQKLEQLKKLGIDPYPPKYDQSSIDVSFARQKHSEIVSVSGRLMRWREHGQVVFADLKDGTGQIQLLFHEKNLTEKFPLLKLFDSGDFMGVTGRVITTNSGEITVEVSSFMLLSKSLRPLPDQWAGLTDEESRYRQRYLDLLLNPNLVDLFRKKALFWQSMRSFLIERGFMEVETPVLENTAGGADAKPFVTHHDALDTDLYLRISMGELWQKRLMVAGFVKTFEIGRQFRNEGVSREHLQDYTQMEFYWPYANYEDSMALVEEMYKYLAKAVFTTSQFKINGHDINLDQPWPRLDYSDLVFQKTGVDIKTASDDDLISYLKKIGIKISLNDGRGKLVDHIFKSFRKELFGPAFLVNHPVEVSPLAKRQPENENFVQRYQVILAGTENGNGYSELNDPIDQAERFLKQQELRDTGDAEAQMNDEDFVTALEYGMPPVSGFGVSERLFSFLADKPIRETVLFPLLRPEKPSRSSSSKQNLSGYSVSDDVKEKFPGMFYAFTKIKGVSITKSDADLEIAKKTYLAEAADIALDQVGNFGLISGYRQLLKSTGIDPNKKRPSPEALLRRIVQGKGIYNINTAVDAYNLAVIKTGVGLGGFNFSKINGFVTLRLSLAGEKVHLLGDDSDSFMAADELVYSDQEKILTVDLNYRDINSTKITEDTKEIILFADGTPDSDPDLVLGALKLGAELIQKYCGGEIEPLILVQ